MAIGSEIATISKEKEARKFENRACSILLISAPHITEQFSSIPDLKDPRWKQDRQKWLNARVGHGNNAMYPGEPTPLLFAAAVLQAELEKPVWPEGHKPEILGIMNPPVFDQNFVNDLVYKLTNQQPRIVCVSNLSESHPTALKIAKIVKKFSSSTIVIFGGMHETGTSPILSKEKQENPSFQKLLSLRTLGLPYEQNNIDFVVSGNGQVPLLELVKVIAANPEDSTEEIKVKVKNRLPSANMSGSAVVSYAAGGVVEDISMEGPPLDYSELPSLRREHLTHLNFYPIFIDERGFPKPTAQLMLQHGCFESCSFCCEALGSKEFVKRDNPHVKQQMQARVEKVVSEMQDLWGKGYKAIFFDDSTFLQNQDLVGPFLDKVSKLRAERAFDFEWGCQTTLLSFTPSLAEKLSKAGCTYVYFGVENKKASANVAKAKRFKDYTGAPIAKENSEAHWEEMFRKCVDLCSEHGLRMGTSLQFGFPGETWQDQKATIDMLVPAYKQGVLAMVALNMNTLYPRSSDYIAALRQNMPVSDWRNDLIRHPDFETFTQNSALALQEKVRLGKVLERLMSNPNRQINLRNWASEQGLSEEQISTALGVRDNTEILNRLLKDVELSQLIEWLALKRSFRRGDRLAVYAKELLGNSVLTGGHSSNSIVGGILDEHRRSYSADAYLPPDYGEFLRQDRGLEVIPRGYLNSSAICRPLPPVRAEAERVFKVDAEGRLSEEEKGNIYETARLCAAKLVEGATPAGVVLCSNTTEAVSLTYWLAGIEDSSGANVVSTNAENVSSWFAMQMHTDHGNTKGEHGYSTFPSFAVRETVLEAYKQRGLEAPSQDLEDSEPVPTGTEVRKLQVLEQTDQEVLEQLEDQVDANTKLLVISHVLRDNGRLLPIQKICQLAREIKNTKNPEDPELCILVDGAQALGNIEKVNYKDLGADFYVATPHKTMGSEVVGLLYFDPDNSRIRPNLKRMGELTSRQQILKKGMFQPGFLSGQGQSYLHNAEAELNPADIAGFVKANEILSKEHGLQDGDFTTIVEKRRNLKQLCSEALQKMNISLEGKTELRVEEEKLDSGTSFVLSFKLKGLRGDALSVIDGEGIQQKLYKTQILMQRLWSKGVYISLINRNASQPEKHRFRVSFGVDNNSNDIELFVQALEESILELSDFEKQLPRSGI